MQASGWGSPVGGGRRRRGSGTAALVQPGTAALLEPGTVALCPYRRVTDTSFVEQLPDHFRIFFWQKVVPLLALPVLAGFVAFSPVVDGWSQTMWIIAAALVGGAVLAYLALHWLRSGITLDKDGLTFFSTGRWQTWPHEKLLKVKLIGKFRARMCYDPGIPDKHMHISFDLFDSTGFRDALLDWYERTTGNAELPVTEAA